MTNKTSPSSMLLVSCGVDVVKQARKIGQLERLRNLIHRHCLTEDHDKGCIEDIIVGWIKADLSERVRPEFRTVLLNRSALFAMHSVDSSDCRLNVIYGHFASCCVPAGVTLSTCRPDLRDFLLNQLYVSEQTSWTHYNVVELLASAWPCWVQVVDSQHRTLINEFETLDLFGDRT